MERIIELLIRAAAVLVVIAVHEFSKALTSTILGDIIPKREGRLTLNPLKHFEPIGFILLYVFGFGWGQPVRTSSMYYKNRKKDTLITYTVPVIVSIVLGMVLFGVWAFLKSDGNMGEQNIVISSILKMCMLAGVYSMELGVCNIIPIAPFCGERILSSLMPVSKSMTFTQMQNILQLIMLFTLFFGFIQPVIDFFVRILMYIVYIAVGA